MEEGTGVPARTGLLQGKFKDYGLGHRAPAASPVVKEAVRGKQAKRSPGSGNTSAR